MSLGQPRHSFCNESNRTLTIPVSLIPRYSLVVIEPQCDFDQISPGGLSLVVFVIREIYGISCVLTHV